MTSLFSWIVRALKQFTVVTLNAPILVPPNDTHNKLKFNARYVPETSIISTQSIFNVTQAAGFLLTDMKNCSDPIDGLQSSAREGFQLHNQETRPFLTLP